MGMWLNLLCDVRAKKNALRTIMKRTIKNYRGTTSFAAGFTRPAAHKGHPSAR
jgi:hypothetical protein